MKMVYCTPSLYLAGGVERVLTTKANYLADELGYEVTIILTDGKGKEPFYPLSSRIKVVQLDIGFEELWSLSFLKKIPVYLKKQRRYKKALTQALMQIRPDVTVSLLRREINFICGIKDGSHKVGELHVNRANYRNFEANDSNFIKNLFSKFWGAGLVKKLRQLDRLVVLTEEDKANWGELSNVVCIPNPLTSASVSKSTTENQRVIAVGRYVYQKGFDLLIEAWARVSESHPTWRLDVYGSGEREPYLKQAETLGVGQSCHLNEAVSNIGEKYAESSIFVLSSRFEGFGMVLIEAMACGVPVVSFACPCGPRDIIDDGTTGFLVDNGNVEQLAERLCRLMDDADLRRQMGERALEASRRYDIGSIGLQWKKLFEEVVKG